MLLQKLKTAEAIHPPKWLPDNTAYMTIMGSVAYGVSSDTSDMDLYGFCLPPKDLVFPHLSGQITGFGTQVQRFEQWQEHHVKAPDSKQEYDFAIFSIVKYFQLCMENNPNMIDSLFTARRCVVHSSPIAELVREKRREFLHKGSWHKFKGYAYAQMHKMRGKANAQNPKRAADIAEVGFDTKFAYHIVRLLSEVEQILTEHDLDLERNREQLKSIRRGEWTLDQIEEFFTTKEKGLEEVYLKSTLRHAPDEAVLKALLMNCLEQHYGNLERAVAIEKPSSQLVRELEDVLARYR